MVRMRAFSLILIALALLTGPAAAQSAGWKEGPEAVPAALFKTINIQFTNATVVEAASALAKISGVPIHVDPSVPNDTRMSIDAHGVSAGSILMTIANDANLQIDPIEPHNGGIILRPYPYQVNNGFKTVQKSPGAPWGAGWAQPIGVQAVTPTAGFSSSSSGQGGIGGSASAFGNASPMTGSAAMGNRSGAGVAVTALNDHEVMVAMPGQNDKGERGVWLALFVINGNEIRWLSSTFHALGGSPAHAVGGAAAP